MKESGIVHGWDLSFGMNNVKERVMKNMDKTAPLAEKMVSKNFLRQKITLYVLEIINYYHSLREGNSTGPPWLIKVNIMLEQKKKMGSRERKEGIGLLLVNILSSSKNLNI